MWAGMIRGSISFACAINIAYKCPTSEECLAAKHFQVIKSTTLAVICATTLLFGTFMRAAQKFLLVYCDPDYKEEKQEIEMNEIRKTES
jgi:site-specific DNA-adenine methylase